MLNSKSLNLQGPNIFTTKKIEVGISSPLMAGQESGGRFKPTAIRMRAARRSSPYPARQDFAKFLGITAPALSNFENGFPLSSGVQDRVIAKMPWITRSWLVDGDEASLTGATLQRLAPLVAEESDTTTPRSRSRGSSGR